MAHERGVRFDWQEGYGAFSVSQSHKQVVADYIAHQVEHHRKWSFEQEFMTLLSKSGAAYDSATCSVEPYAVPYGTRTPEDQPKGSWTNLLRAVRGYS